MRTAEEQKMEYMRFLREESGMRLQERRGGNE